MTKPVTVSEVEKISLVEIHQVAQRLRAEAISEMFAALGAAVKRMFTAKTRRAGEATQAS